MRRILLSSAASVAALWLGGSQAGAVTEDQFALRSTADLVALCAADPAGPQGTAALNLCAGFGLGVYAVLAEIQSAPRATRMFCLPTPEPTRTEAVAAFVAWGKDAPGTASLPPADGMAKFLMTQYPCPAKK